VVFGVGIKLVLPELKASPKTSGPTPWRRVTSGPTV